MKPTALKYTVMLYKQGTGVIAFETVALDDMQAVKVCMDEAFQMFPDAKFALHGIEKSDGNTTITTTRYLGRL